MVYLHILCKRFGDFEMEILSTHFLILVKVKA